jgi:hypothetical protein
MLKIQKLLNDLQTLSLEHQSEFLAAVEMSHQTSWLYYFPFLFCFSLARSRTILWEWVDESICIYFLRERDQGLRLDLYLPPFPFTTDALKTAEERVNWFNSAKSCRIIWLEEAQRSLVEPEGYKVEFQEDEFIYDTKLVAAASGSQFYRLRQRTSRARRIPHLQIRNYRAGDRDACRALLSRWRRHLVKDKGVDVGGFSYTRSALEHASLFKDNILKGEVIIVDDELRAFTFGGKINSSYGSIFITISDHAFDGLGYIQRQSFIKDNQDFRFYNDSSDTGRKGILNLKDAFRPVAKNKLYRARQL